MNKDESRFLELRLEDEDGEFRFFKIEKEDLLSLVVTVVTTDPRMIMRINQAMDRGLEDALMRSKEQAAQYEFALVDLFWKRSKNEPKRVKKSFEFAMSKIRPYIEQRKTFSNWSSRDFGESEETK